MTTLDETTKTDISIGTTGEPKGRSASIQLPKALRGSRRIQSRSRVSARGILAARFRDSKRLSLTGYESSTERAFFLVALTDPNTVDIVEQPFTLRYIDEAGRTRRYTFDYLVTMRDGRRIAVEVKNSAQARKPKVVERIRQAASRLVPEHADEVFLFTEESFTRTQIENAEQFLNCQREVDPEADRQLGTAVSTLRGSTTVSDLIKISGLAERGYPAVIRAMYSGSLQWNRERLIGPKTMVRREVVQ